MGQHKYNPIAQAAKEGKLPQKKKPMSTRERRARLEAAVMAKLPILSGWWKGWL